MSINKNNEDGLSPEIIEHRAGSMALFEMSQKYCAVVCGGIFAIILAQPELPSMITLGPFRLNDFVGWYLSLGVLGIFHKELWIAYAKVIGHEVPFPEFIKRIFVLFVIIGMLIFVVMLTALLNQGAEHIHPKGCDEAPRP